MPLYKNIGVISSVSNKTHVQSQHIGSREVTDGTVGLASFKCMYYNLMYETLK